MVYLCCIKTFVLFIIIMNIVNTIFSKPSQILVENRDSENEINENEEKLTYDANNSRYIYAKKMMTYMNFTVDPCEDFYEYACGNWKNVIEPRQAQHKRSNLLDIRYKLIDAVDDLLQRSSSDLDTDYESEFKLTQQFYKSCLNADLIEIKKSSEYMDVIRSIGGFPAVDNDWDPSTFSWFNMSAHLTNYGVSGLINELILPVYPFPPYFELPELGFSYIVHSDNINSNNSSGYIMNEKEMRKYLTAYDVDESKIKNTITGIFEFWHAALNISDTFDEDLVKCQLLHIDENTTFTEWENYFDIAWMGKHFDTEYPCDYYYIQLAEVCETHKPAVANYLALKFLYKMDAKLEDKNYQRDYCVALLQNTVPYIIDNLYLKAHFSIDVSNEVTKIVKEIQKSLRFILEEADWLDEGTRAEALQKESVITSRIGNFKDAELTNKLIREMDNLDFVEDNYNRNNINLHKFGTFLHRYNGINSESLDNSTKPLELLIGSQVNSFYYMIDNSINVMAGILHPPAYHKAWPNSLKFGTLGFLIGHEFTHGFDSTGAQYDSNGQERYWWSKKSGTVFEERANCYVDHFNNYMIPEINRSINGNQTKDENIADSGGLREALMAYRRYTKELSKNLGQNTILHKEQMPGLDLSPEQLFFLGFAQMWCSSYKEEHFWEELKNEHTTDKYRVLGAITNFDEFSKAYECREGTKMNPKADKCRLW